MSRGEVDVMVSAWLPASHGEYLAPFEQDVIKVTVLYEPYCIWGVPDYVRVRSTISTRLPTAAEADALARPVTQPVLVVQYVNADLQGVPVEAATTLFAADAVQLTVEADGDLS